MPNYIPSIGMEVHAELRTESKMFCRCQVAFGGLPNTRVCPVCMGLPGTLPVPNRRAVEMVLMTALALNCQVAMNSVFHRKNYFYPDLPKGYQVSQYGETNPLGYYGYLDIPAENGTKRIKIQRVHLEEDTGKLMHLPGGGSGVDYNRAGTPLMEIVSGFPPDIANADEAKEYLVQLRQILLYLEVCDGKMEEGSLRCEPNISVRPENQEQLGTKTELKNLNSFRSVQLGSQFEIRRQIAALEQGQVIRQETRGWNEDTESSYLMRTKESEQDYRYFPDPDLIPMEFTEEYIEGLRARLPELPLAKEQRYVEKLGLSDYDAKLLVSELDWARYFEAGVEAGGEPKALCNWMNGELAKHLNETGQVARVGDTDRDGREVSKVKPTHLVDLIGLLEKGAISGKMAKDLFADVFKTGEMPSALAQKQGLSQISDASAIEQIVVQVLQNHPDVVEKYKGGKEGVLGFLVGQVMKESKGRANPQLVQGIMKDKLN